MSRTPPRAALPSLHDPQQAKFDRLYRRYASWLKRMLRARFGKAIDGSAEDLVHDAYLRVAPGKLLEGARHPQALLLRVASNLAIDQLRRGAISRISPLAIEQIEETSDYGYGAVQEEIVLLNQLVQLLPEKEKDVFVLSRFAGLTNQEIANRCGLAVGTVEWRMTRALKFLAERLRD